MRRSVLTLLGLAAVSLAQPAWAQAPEPTPAPTDVPPHWTHRPADADFEAVYPGRARDKGISGAATLSCAVAAGGDLTDCTVAAETPAGQGFGAAALKLAPLFHIDPGTHGAIVGAWVQIPMRFGLQ